MLPPCLDPPPTLVAGVRGGCYGVEVEEMEYEDEEDDEDYYYEGGKGVVADEGPLAKEVEEEGVEENADEEVPCRGVSGAGTARSPVDSLTAPASG